MTVSWKEKLDRYRALALGAAAAGLIAAAGTGAASSAAVLTSAATPTVTTSPCGWKSVPPKTYDHVIWVVMENHSYKQVIGGPGTTARKTAPYLNQIADKCGLATKFRARTHPSLPNYIALTSGHTWGLTRDCEPAVCAQKHPSIFGQLKRAGRGWRTYAESMNINCGLRSFGRYAARHNPATYYPDVRTDCRKWDVPFGTLTGGRFLDDLRNNRLASLSLVVPDLCSDTHDCKTPTGDAWLARVLPMVIASPAYRAGKTAVFITYDEGAGGTRGENCLSAGDESCHIPTVVLAPAIKPGTRASTSLNTYSMLKATEQMFGLPPLGVAAKSSTISMRAPFHI